MFSFIETKTFSRLVQKSLSDEEYRALQAALIADPKAGPVIPGSGVRASIPASVLKALREEIEDG